MRMLRKFAKLFKMFRHGQRGDMELSGFGTIIGIVIAGAVILTAWAVVGNTAMNESNVFAWLSANGYSIVTGAPAGSWLPTADNVSDIGDGTHRWHNEYLGGNLNVSGNASVASNLTVGGTLYAKTGRAATIVVACSDATAAEKAQANYTLPGTNDNVTLWSAFQALPEMGGLALPGTKTGRLVVLGSSINPGGRFDLPPLQNAVIDFGLSGFYDHGFRTDSMVNSSLVLPLMDGNTGNITLEFYPRTAGPDGAIIFSANDIVIGTTASTSGTSTTGTKFNNASVNFSGNSIKYREINLTQFTTPIDISVGNAMANRIITSTNPACRLRKSTDTTIASGTSTNISFDTETYDVLGMHTTTGDTTKITFTIPGIYDIGAATKWAVNATGSRELRILMNGGTDLCQQRMLVDLDLYQYQTVYGQYIFEKGDYIQLYVRQTCGVDLDLLAEDPTYPSLWVTKVN